jgi:hypothetical protein
VKSIIKLNFFSNVSVLSQAVFLLKGSTVSWPALAWLLVMEVPLHIMSHTSGELLQNVRDVSTSNTCTRVLACFPWGASEIWFCRNSVKTRSVHLDQQWPTGGPRLGLIRPPPRLRFILKNLNFTTVMT